MGKKIILTGIRANNDLHIGNYLGALMPIITRAKEDTSEYQINLFVPDLHSFTTAIEHSKLLQQIIDNIKIYVAAGLPLDKSNVHIYRQSYVPAHSELAWILDCFTSFGELNRMIQFKDKSQKIHEKHISAGLFNYPVLMAADILLYDAVYVPVGDDQKQHLEFTRTIAQRFNNKFPEVFTIPYPTKKQNSFFSNNYSLRIMNLIDPSKKMSKSDANKKGIIFLSDGADVAKSKIMSAATDSNACIQYEPNIQPGISNLIQILASFSGRSIKSIVKSYAGQSSYLPLKQEVVDEVCTFLTNFQLKYKSINEDALLNKLVNDEKIINKIANDKLFQIQKAIGLR